MFLLFLPDYHSNCTHSYYKTVKLTKFSSTVNRVDSYMIFFYKGYFRFIKGCFTEIRIKTKNKLTLNFLAFYWIPIFSSSVFDR